MAERLSLVPGDIQFRSLREQRAEMNDPSIDSKELLAIVEQDAQAGADNLTNFMLATLDKQPTYAPPGRPKPTRKVYADVFNQEVQTLEKLAQASIPDFVSKLAFIRKILPSLDTAQIENFLHQIVTDAERTMQANQVADEPDKKEQLTALVLPKARVNALDEQLRVAIDLEAQKQFAPLIARARADVRMQLIAHANTVGISPAEAQAFIQERVDINVPFVFKITLVDIPSMGRQSGDASDHRIRINLDSVEILQDGQLNETDLLSTMVHELVHTVSNKLSPTAIGLEDATIFSKSKELAEAEEPETYLNELTTELMAIDIMSKYYEDDTPGTTKLTKGQRQTYHYKSLIEDYRELQDDEPIKMAELTSIMYDAMFRGTIDKVKRFFKKNPTIFKQIEEMCTLEGHFEKTGRSEARKVA